MFQGGRMKLYLSPEHPYKGWTSCHHYPSWIKSASEWLHVSVTAAWKMKQWQLHPHLALAGPAVVTALKRSTVEDGCVCCCSWGREVKVWHPGIGEPGRSQEWDSLTIAFSSLLPACYFWFMIKFSTCVVLSITLFSPVEITVTWCFARPWQGARN